MSRAEVVEHRANPRGLVGYCAQCVGCGWISPTWMIARQAVPDHDKRAVAKTKAARAANQHNGTAHGS